MCPSGSFSETFVHHVHACMYSPSGGRQRPSAGGGGEGADQDAALKERAMNLERSLQERDQEVARLSLIVNSNKLPPGALLGVSFFARANGRVFLTFLSSLLPQRMHPEAPLGYRRAS